MSNQPNTVSTLFLILLRLLKISLTSDLKQSDQLRLKTKEDFEFIKEIGEGSFSTVKNSFKKSILIILGYECIYFYLKRFIWPKKKSMEWNLQVIFSNSIKALIVYFNILLFKLKSATNRK
jgi:hypothetical protein